MPDSVTPIEQVTAIAVAALRRLGEAGQPRDANRLAAKGYAALRRVEPRLAERLNGVMHRLATLEAASDLERSTSMTNERELDVRTEPPAHRHAMIFDAFDRMAVGDAFILVNDHDPKPLYYQLAAEQGGTFSWEYLRQGPTVWLVRIGRTAPAAEAPIAGRTEIEVVRPLEAES